MTRSIVVLLAMSLVGCPGKSDGEESTGEATEATSAGPTTPTGSGEETGASGGVTTGAMCEDPADVAIGPPVAVHLRNEGDADVFIRAPSSCEGAPYRIVDAEDQTLQIELGTCPPPCAEVLAFQACGCPDAACATSVIRVAPGGVFDGAWSGASVAHIMLPAACIPAECEGTSCAIEQQAPAGTYRLTATHSKSVQCGSPECTCEPSADGWCEIVADVSLGPEEPASEVAFAYPDLTDVTLVFP